MLLDIHFFQDHPLVLFDPARGLDSPLADAPGVLVRHPQLALPQELTPKLIDWRSANLDLRAKVFEDLDHRGGSLLGAGIDSAFGGPMSIQELADHLGRQSIRILGRFGRHLVRHWDPHVFMHLMWIWPATELRRLFGPVTKWALFLPDQTPSVQRDACTGRGLPSTEQQHQALVDVAVLNAALVNMSWRFPEIPDLGPALWAHVQRARGLHRLQDEADLALFARQAQRWGEHFDKQPDIQRALAMAADGQTLYRDALAQIDEKRLQQIEAELSA